MTDPSRVDIARAELRESYTIAGKPRTWLHSTEFALGYDPETDKLVVQLRGDKEIHMIPMANVKGTTLERRQAAPPAAEVKQEAANGRPAPAVGAGGGSRRARSPQ